MFFHWLRDYGKANRHATVVVNGIVESIFKDAQAASPAIFKADSRVQPQQQAKFEYMCPWAALHLMKLEGAEAKLVMEELVDRLEIGLREGGVGDMKVGVHVRKYAAALHGRVRRYATCLEMQDWDALAVALAEHEVDKALALRLKDAVKGGDKEKSTKKSA